MTTQWQETLIHLLALAARLEGEGQYNIAKLARAARRVRRRVERQTLMKRQTSTWASSTGGCSGRHSAGRLRQRPPYPGGGAETG